MIDGKNVLALIPARGGSKRLPNKNTIPLNGKPLIGWTIEAAVQSQYVDRVVVSTDSENIAEVSVNYGADIPFMRPSELSKDTTSTNSVILHALDSLKSLDFQILLLLQPTSPLRQCHHINESLKLLIEKNVQGVVSVSECSHSPLWANVLPDDNKMGSFIRAEVLGKRSQDLPKHYSINGAIYAYTVKSLLSNNGIFYSNEVVAYKMSHLFSVDVDEMVDLKYAKFLMNQCNLENCNSNMIRGKGTNNEIL
ncbi:MAG: CMP-N,N'-diacetyllegionaminic acid synthase [Desulforhopalus sp.]|jgi:CMP-N,N'-diacetyllegionaminic acid synthase